MRRVTRNAWPSVLTLLLCLTPGLILAQPVGDVAHRRAHSANLTLEVQRRIFPAGHKVAFSVSLYNLRVAQVRAYRVSLEELAPTSGALESSDPQKPGSVVYRLRHLDLTDRRVVAATAARLDQFYYDSWRDKQLGLALPEGVYALEATGEGEARARTWLAVSSRALFTKTSRGKLLAWLVNSETGQPVAGAWLAAYGPQGQVAGAQTGRDGLARFTLPASLGSCLVATHSGPVTFVLASAPTPPPPYRCYLYTDRPVYRPGQLVRFRGTVRKLAGAGYAVPTGLETVKVKIKAAGGSTVYQEDLPLNDWGTFCGEFQFAPEPPLGQYDLVTEIKGPGGPTLTYQRFEVLAYRKPEFSVDVSIPDRHYIGGDTIPVTISAEYFFGGPVSNGKVAYEVSFQESGNRVPARVVSAAGLGSAASVGVEDSFKGEARLDKAGKLILPVKTRYAPVGRWLHVSATVSELALRPQSAQGHAEIAAARIALNLNLDHYEFLPGQTVQAAVATRDLEDKPVSAAVRVILVEHKRDREGRPYEERTEKLVETSSRGEVTVPFKLPRPGTYQVEAWARDDLGDPAFAQTELQVVEKLTAPHWPALALTGDPTSYSPGQTAKVHVATDALGAWMLVTVEGDGVYEATVRRVLAHEFDLKVPIREAYKPSVTVHACIVRRGEATRASLTHYVPPTDRALQVLLEPDRKVYQPAQTARFTLTTRDWKGAAVPAEVGLGVVDASLYEIREDQTPSPFDFFWGSRAEGVESAFSLDHLYPGGGMQAMPTAAAPMSGRAVTVAAKEPAGGGAGEAGPEAPRVRKLFADTAYWGPSVVTGPDGRAEVSFTVPDNLTTWRATGRGLARDARAGEARKDVKATLPLLVRLTLPRFYVAGDEGTAAAIVHNYTTETRSVKVALTAEGAAVLTPADQSISVGPGDIQRLTWKVRAEGPDQARFLVSADGGPGASDAMQATLPVVPSGVRNVEAVAGMTADAAQAALTLPADAIPSSAQVTVTLSPSLAGPIFEALDYLTTYPYGCAEQTMSGFLPDIIVARTLDRLGAQRPKPKMLDRFVSFGLQKLLRFQHDDGGWHWWEFDQSDPYISAYVVYGLKLAEEAGYVAAHDPMVRGVAYLQRALPQEQYREAQGYLLWALARAGLWDAGSLKKALAVADDLYASREKLDLFSRASLALALHHLAGEKTLPAPRATALAARAGEMAGELEGLAVRTGTAVHWTAGARSRYSWLDSDVEVTSQVLSALLELRPRSDSIGGAVRWLMAARRDKAWTCTKDTASAVLALTTYLEQQKELTPDFNARVLLGDRQVGEARMTAADVFGDPKVITLSAADLHRGDNNLRVEKAGAGNLYWTARLSYLIPAEKALPLARGISVKRVYHIPSEDPATADSQAPGTVVAVDVTITAEENLRYALLEEPVPAGCEVVAGDDERWGNLWDRREVWDNRIVFFFDYLAKGEHTVTYVLRAEAPGTYGILPAAASLMYFPEVRGHNQLVRMRVREEQ